MKDFMIASGDFFNLTNRGNLYSNPNSPSTATISLNGCSPNTGAIRWFHGIGAGSDRIHLRPSHSRHDATVGVNGFRAITQIAPGSTPFAFQAGVKFVF